MKQLTLSDYMIEDQVQTVDLASYDKIIVYFSGGKDSLACLLHLFEQGVSHDKIELWHHDIDGREGSNLMDWACTPDYCRKVAQAFDLPIYYSWKVGGFEGEMLRENSLTSPTKFETPEGEIKQIGGTRGKPNTRLKFPQVSANLSVRWCSAYLKIDIGAAAIRNQKRFEHSRTLTVSGERAEESAARANYETFEKDRSDNRDGRNARHVDRWRPIHKWSEAEVWAIIKRWKVNPHPAYHLGWGGASVVNSVSLAVITNGPVAASFPRIALTKSLFMKGFLKQPFTVRNQFGSERIMACPIRWIAK